jgi:N-acetylglucosamine-6-phosphate deacetylase
MSYASIPFETAIVNATATPALLLGIERECGTIDNGKRADLVVWNDRYEILTTLVAGQPVYGAAHLSAGRATTFG